MIPVVRPELPELSEYVSLLEEIWESRMLSNFGPKARSFEAMCQEYLGANHVLSCTSGETGLMIAIAALDLPEGSPCFLPSFTFNSTMNVALWNKLRPVFVDVDPDTFTMSPSSLSAALRRHPQAGVVLATHVFGNPCDTVAIEVLARQHGSFIVYDAAHGYGSHRDGAKVGTFGDAEVFSLSGTKLVTTAEGGLVTTPHDWLAEKVTYFRAHGFQNDYDSKVIGVNGKFSELHAALGLLTLSKVEEAVTQRHAIVKQYRQALKGMVTWQSIRPTDRSTFKDVNIGLGSRSAAVEAKLTSLEIQTKRYFRPLHTMSAFASYQDAPLPNTEHVYATTLCVPAYAGMPEWVIERVAEVVQSTIKAPIPA